MAKNIIFVGDVHATWGKFDDVIDKHAALMESDLMIQVGDMGLGFGTQGEPKSFPDSVRFIRGNHDDPEVCRKHPNYLGDYGFDEENGIFYVSGAWSIDWEYRTPGRDWWFEEQLSDRDLRSMLGLAKEVKDRIQIVVSHDCPRFVFDDMRKSRKMFRDKAIPNRTTMALDDLFGIVKPKHWVFGHHHTSYSSRIQGTHFRCVDILETHEVEIE